jgi:multiple sugar transport system substrate-binding protein
MNVMAATYHSREKGVVPMRRPLTLLSCLVLALFVVTGIGEAAKITWMEVAGQSKIDAFAEYYAVWQKKNPHIEVEYMPLGYHESFDKLKVMYISGIPIDVSPMYRPAYTTLYAESDGLLPLDNLVKRDGIKAADYLPGLFDDPSLFWNGKRLALPYAVSGHILWYNSDLFDTAGLQYPATSWEAPGWTWDEFVNSARKLTRDLNGDGTPDQWGVGNPPPTDYMLFAWNQKMFNDDFTEFVLATPQGAEAIQRITDLRRLHDVVAPRGTDLFSSGQAGMAFHAADNLYDALSWKFNWNWGVWPKGERRVSTIYVDNLYIARASKYPEESWQWLKFLTHDVDGQLLYAAKGNRKIPALRQAAARWVSEELPKLYPGLNINVLLDAATYSVTHLGIEGAPDNSRIRPLLNNAFLEIENGEKAPLQALQEIKPAIDTILQEAAAARGRQ